MKAQNDHDPAVICYDSKYAANTTDGTWDPKTNLDAVRICRDLYETEHARRDGGVSLPATVSRSLTIASALFSARFLDSAAPSRQRMFWGPAEPISA
eukprot:COSAG01_NODE_22585_length_849_cov_17.653333_1_plen_97_part_00